jgi:hypothetical protein
MLKGFPLKCCEINDICATRLTGKLTEKLRTGRGRGHHSVTRSAEECEGRHKAGRARRGR